MSPLVAFLAQLICALDDTETRLDRIDCAKNGIVAPRV